MLTCPGGRLRSLHCAAQSLRSRRNRRGSPGPGSAWKERGWWGQIITNGSLQAWDWLQTSPHLASPGDTGDTAKPSLLQSPPDGWVAPSPLSRLPSNPCLQLEAGEALMDWRLLDGPHGPPSSFHHWRSLPHHKLRPICSEHRGRQWKGDHSAPLSFGMELLKRGST